MCQNCSGNATCDSSNSYTCECLTDYVGDGYTCERINHPFFSFISSIDCCLALQDKCHNCSINADCIITNESLGCACSTGYFGDGYNCTGI